VLRRPLAGRLADRAYLILAGLAAAAAVALVAYLIWRTAAQTGAVWDAFGVWGFLTGTEWIPAPATGDPVFGALPFIYGTLMTSAVAMAIAVPLSVGIALATTVVLPRRLRGPIGGVIDLLAAVPSVVFGFWGIVVLVPFAQPGLEWIAEHNLRALAVVFAVATLTAAVLQAPALRIALALLTGAIGLAIALAAAGVVDVPFTLLEGPVLAQSYLMSSLVLAIMVIPIITAISREVLATVPVDQQEAAYALGATRWEMVRDAMLPWARSGIVGASALGLGRAMGETIALAMILGNIPGIWSSLLGPGATAASVIALETGEAGELQLAALTALAVILFALTFLVNGVARLLVRRSGSGGSPWAGATGGGLLTRAMARRGTGASVTVVEPPAADDSGRAVGIVEPPAAPTVPAGTRPREVVPVSRERRIRSGLAEGLILASVAIAAVPLGLLLGRMVVDGIGMLSGTFFTGIQYSDPTDVSGAGIGNALVGTLILTGVALVIAAPFGILTALFMNEVGQTGGWPGRLASAIGFFVDVLLGMPSIVAGLTVYLGIVVVTEQFSALAGGIALAIIMFPIIVRSSDEVLRLVPSAQREAALALGAPRWRTACSVVIPAAAPGILTGVVLAVARAAGETAPLLFTSLGSQVWSTNLTEPIAALPQLIFFSVVNVRTPQTEQFAWGATLVLVAAILVLNLLARLIARAARATEAR
jgi:phosphate transport system permease protein